VEFAAGKLQCQNPAGRRILARRKTMKKTFLKLTVLALAGALALTACGDAGSGPIGFSQEDLDNAYREGFDAGTATGVPITNVTLSPSGPITLTPGMSQNFTLTVTGNPGGYSWTTTSASSVTWTVAGNSSPGTAINASGSLTIDAGETVPGTLTVRAASKIDPSKYREVTVNLQAMPGVQSDYYGTWTYSNHKIEISSTEVKYTNTNTSETYTISPPSWTAVRQTEGPSSGRDTTTYEENGWKIYGPITASSDNGQWPIGNSMRYFEVHLPRTAPGSAALIHQKDDGIGYTINNTFWVYTK
jgi:hypothetical protein